MKKLYALVLTALLTTGLLAGCSSGNGGEQNPPAAPEAGQTTPEAEISVEPVEPANDLEPLKVGASITPHGEILTAAAALLEAKGYALELVEYTDYVQPNLALEDGELQANYFQHYPYLEEFNESRGTHLVSAANIHYEPFGLYGGKQESLEDLAPGAVIAIPNDGTNEARALLLLEQEGLITLQEGIGMTATVLDIVDNPQNLDIREIEAAQTPRALQDVDYAVINGNYALQAGLSVGQDALAVEDLDSLAAQIYPNILCVREGDENTPATQALIEVLTSEEIRTFIEETYDGAVIPVF